MGAARERVQERSEPALLNHRSCSSSPALGQGEPPTESSADGGPGESIEVRRFQNARQCFASDAGAVEPVPSNPAKHFLMEPVQ